MNWGISNILFLGLFAMAAAALALFQSVGCVMCHSGPMFSAAGVFGSGDHFRAFPSIPDPELERRYAFTRDGGLSPTLQGIWRVPSLRNASRTAPYFHNGAVDDLEEAVRIMARVQLGMKISDEIAQDLDLHWMEKEWRLVVTGQRSLSTGEVGDIVAFLKALDGDLPLR